MAEYSKEKLYFLKLPKDFFQSYKMRALEGIAGGKDYELMYLKLLCESISHNGYLRFDERTPYTAEMIAGITNSPIDTVRVGIEVLQQFGLVEINDSRTIYIPDVPSMTGTTTIGAAKKQKQIASRGEVESKVENFPPREIRQLDNGMSTNVSIPTENLEDSSSPKGSSSSHRKKKYDQSKKQNPLLELMVKFKFLEEWELEDPQWEDLLNEFLLERKQELGDKQGFIDAKKRIDYVLDRISTTVFEGESREGKQNYHREVDPQIMATIENKFAWFSRAIRKAVEQLEAVERITERYQQMLDSEPSGEAEFIDDDIDDGGDQPF